MAFAILAVVFAIGAGFAWSAGFTGTALTVALLSIGSGAALVSDSVEREGRRLANLLATAQDARRQLS